MGISLQAIEMMQNLGLFSTGRISVLDIGSSNLYSASAVGLQKFLSAHGIATTAKIKAFTEKLELGSAYDSISGGTNRAFVGELFEKAGMKYDAIDIADGYRTTILDLNHQSAPPHFVGAFDLVLNFGTTEHLLNQYNAFKVIHDATRMGGYIVNALPCIGFLDHGYITYTPRCMFDLAGYNNYELIGFWYSDPSGHNDPYAPVKNYLTYFPSLANTLVDQDQKVIAQKLAQLNLPDIGLMVVYRKVNNRPFAGALERSTSVGLVPSSVTAVYESALVRSSKSLIRKLFSR